MSLIDFSFIMRYFFQTAVREGEAALSNLTVKDLSSLSFALSSTTMFAVSMVYFYFS
jgi:hypothetical protein